MESTSRNYLTDAIAQDLAEGRYDHVRTRFAPEPNAYLHIGHAFSIFMTYGMAERFHGCYTLRFDDTNPSREKAEYVEAIRDDVRWLGYEWEDREHFASDYFETLYEWACLLILNGKAYVCDLSDEELTRYRGTDSFTPEGRRITPPGRDSPWRNRGVDENLDLFRRMREGEFGDGARTLRARIDMGHDNLLMRDPVMYRIKHVEHHRTGTEWCIYPTYDWAHGQSDSLEGITHSICGMEWRHHRPLYEWFLAELAIRRPRQIEYPRIRLSHTVTSKRHLVPLVEDGHVEGWDDPRLPTIRGLRRRGVPAEVIRSFCERMPVVDNKLVVPVEMQFFEHCLREYLNRTAPRTMAVLEPLELVLENEPEDERTIEVPVNPEDLSAGTRVLWVSRVLLVEREDFMVVPSAGFRRLSPGATVRLRHLGLITCREVRRADNGDVTELRAVRVDDSSLGAARARTATLHWISARHAVRAVVRLLEPLFTSEDPMDPAVEGGWMASLNPASMTVLRECCVDPETAARPVGYRCQFERKGYFCVDTTSAPGEPVFNRIVALKDRWANVRKQS